MPDEEEMADDSEEEPPAAELATAKAAEMHSALNQIRSMALQAEAELETMAKYADSDDIESTVDELQEAAAAIRAVHQRIQDRDG